MVMVRLWVPGTSGSARAQHREAFSAGSAATTAASSIAGAAAPPLPLRATAFCWPRPRELPLWPRPPPPLRPLATTCSSAAPRPRPRPLPRPRPPEPLPGPSFGFGSWPAFFSLPAWAGVPALGEARRAALRAGVCAGLVSSWGAATTAPEARPGSRSFCAAGTSWNEEEIGSPAEADNCAGSRRPAAAPAGTAGAAAFCVAPVAAPQGANITWSPSVSP
mmetsp:Transcript_96096/g.260952  ORF Transcript_96096/g.260952 Transcript_96096/m.260952 type:complete len:220 (-) Transcript_96096:303-962(-)